MTVWLLALRVTIMLDEDLAKKLRLLQAKRLKGSSKSISFSNVLNEVVRKGLWSFYVAK